MPPKTFVIPGFPCGELRIGPRPDAADLAATMAAMRAEGITVVVSLLEQAEAEAVGLAEQDRACAEAGITFLSQPIADFGLPDRDALDRLTAVLRRHLDAGDKVLVHCHAGIGRSGMTACALLIANGQTPASALQAVATARGQSVPDTPEQRSFVLSLSEA